MDASFANSKEQIAQARRDDTDWSSLTRMEQVRSIELEGYVVLPDLLSPFKVIPRSHLSMHVHGNPYNR